MIKIAANINSQGQDIYINPQHVISISMLPDGPLVVLSSGAQLNLLISIEELLALLVG